MAAAMAASTVITLILKTTVLILRPQIGFLNRCDCDGAGVCDVCGPTGRGLKACFSPSSGFEKGIGKSLRRSSSRQFLYAIHPDSSEIWRVRRQ